MKGLDRGSDRTRRECAVWIAVAVMMATSALPMCESAFWDMIWSCFVRSPSFARSLVSRPPRWSSTLLICVHINRWNRLTWNFEASKDSVERITWMSNGSSRKTDGLCVAEAVFSAMFSRDLIVVMEVSNSLWEMMYVVKSRVMS